LTKGKGGAVIAKEKRTAAGGKKRKVAATWQKKFNWNKKRGKFRLQAIRAVGDVNIVGRDGKTSGTSTKKKKGKRGTDSGGKNREGNR